MAGYDPRKPIRILVAEDDEISRLVITTFLADEYYLTITTVEDGRAALLEATTKAFDLMIFDQNLPFISGDRVIRHLRASNCLNSTTPVIRLSADSSIRSAIAVASEQPAGPHSIASLPKPVLREDLLTAVKRVLAID